MRKLFLLIILSVLAVPVLGVRNNLRAPAYQLIAIDPSTNLWSMTDTLYADATRHWTGSEHPLLGVLTVDGIDYRFLGRDFTVPVTVAPNSEWGEWTARYTAEAPSGDWTSESFDDSSWKSGKGAFGTDGEGGSFVMIRNEFCRTGASTRWTSPELWLRRTIVLPDDVQDKDWFLEYTNDDSAEIYVNGVRVVSVSGKESEHDMVPLCGDSLLHPGDNLISAHVKNAEGYGIIDIALLAADKCTERFPRTAVQKSVDYLPTQTIYEFACGPVDLTLTFTAPFLPDNLELASRPVNYITYDVKSSDGKSHRLSLTLEASPLWAVDHPGQPTEESLWTSDGLTYMRSGTTMQHMLEKWGDDRRIDWGYFYLVADSRDAEFTVEGKRLALRKELGKSKGTSGYVMVGYDDVQAIQYLGQNLRPYWNRSGFETICGQFVKAAEEYSVLMKECGRFNDRLMADAEEAGGKEYAELCSLAWRQTFAAHKLVATPEGLPLYLSKENFSNGSIGTVDLSYPSIPIFLLYNVELAKALMNPILDYCSSDRWGKPFAAHDVGRYPLANGQNYGGDMPVEESGNMLIMAATIAKAEGNAGFAMKYMPLFSQWAGYLEEYGLDPENQLCTDDFAGHFAHNANLAGKAVLGIAAYGYLADMAGDRESGRTYMQKARAYAAEWERMADDGDHYRLTFDHPGTWSQKYNLVWDKLFGWNIFPEKVFGKEIAFYLAHQNIYGLPLDCREQYTKTDWVIWSATMADNETDFRALVKPIWKFMDETEDRSPMSDWTWTDRPHSQQFRNRSVVGAYFMKLLDRKWNEDRYEKK